MILIFIKLYNDDSLFVKIKKRLYQFSIKHNHHYSLNVNSLFSFFLIIR